MTNPSREICGRPGSKSGGIAVQVCGHQSFQLTITNARRTFHAQWRRGERRESAHPASGHAQSVPAATIVAAERSLSEASGESTEGLEKVSSNPTPEGRFAAFGMTWSYATS